MELNSKLKKGSTVAASRYDAEWIREAWGWDTPEEFVYSQGRNLRPRVQYCLELADLRSGMRILDVGCGRGEIVLYCARRGIHAVGVDYSPDAIAIAEQAKERHTAAEQRRMRFICDDVKNIQGESFDRIFMLDLVEHLYDWELHQLFQVCKRLLTPTGEIIIHTLPNRWVYEITYRKLLRMVMPWLPKNPRNEREMAIHINEMSITHLNNLLRLNGFNCRIWLDELIVSQAKWHAKGGLEDKRETFYHWMRNPFVAMLYKTLAITPLRLLIVNDIFAVAFQQGQSIRIRPPMRRNLTESLLCRLCG
jgi:2-polyprenyl-3-methyl-5-hydroxy-6-metoxy-1,4-benzoquinol methylase